MTEHLVINEEGNLDTTPEKYPVALKIPALIFSYLFHPLFIIGWVILYLLYINNLVFLGVDPEDRIVYFLRVFGTSIFLPIVTVLLLKGLGFIQSIQLHTQKDRIIPYVACITFFFSPVNRSRPSKLCLSDISLLLLLNPFDSGIKGENGNWKKE